MPKIDKVLTLEISPEQFLNSCSATELQELEQLLYSYRYQSKMYPKRLVPTMENPPLPPPKFKIE
jgi:hypothetical protein